MDDDNDTFAAWASGVLEAIIGPLDENSACSVYRM